MGTETVGTVLLWVIVENLSVMVHVTVCIDVTDALSIMLPLITPFDDVMLAALPELTETEQDAVLAPFTVENPPATVIFMYAPILFSVPSLLHLATVKVERYGAEYGSTVIDFVVVVEIPRVSVTVVDMSTLPEDVSGWEVNELP